jgi:hypothetical protein
VDLTDGLFYNALLMAAVLKLDMIQQMTDEPFLPLQFTLTP